MPSVSEKQAHMFFRAHHDQEYARKRGITPAAAAKMHGEDLATGRFFSPEGKPKYNQEQPRSAADMEDDA